MQAGAVFQVNLTGLDPNKRYTIVVTSNRDQVPANRTSGAGVDERWSDYELVGATSSTEASGGVTTVVVSPTHVRFESEDNTAREILSAGRTSTRVLMARSPSSRTSTCRATRTARMRPSSSSSRRRPQRAARPHPVRPRVCPRSPAMQPHRCPGRPLPPMAAAPSRATP